MKDSQRAKRRLWVFWVAPRADQVVGLVSPANLASLTVRVKVGRIRTIKPEFFTHSELFDAERETGLPLRLAYAGLWTCCDREGRFKWRPRELKLAILPFDECDFSRVLDALATRGFIVGYASGDERFGYVPTWKAHQFINNKEPASHIPQPSLNHKVDACLTREPRVEDANITRGVKEGKGREEELEGKGRVADTVDTRILSESVGIFGMREQADMNRLLAVYLKDSGKSVNAAIEAMIARWKDYQEAMPDLEWTYSSSYKFFTSGNWDKPDGWPRQRRTSAEAAFLGHGADS